MTKVEFEPAGNICYIGWELVTVVIEQVSRCTSRDATPRQTVVVLDLANDLMGPLLSPTLGVRAGRGHRYSGPHGSCAPRLTYERL